MGISYNGLLHLPLKQDDVSSNLTVPTKRTWVRGINGDYTCLLSKMMRDHTLAEPTKIDLVV